MPEVRRKITNLDPVTGKKLVAFLTGAPLAGNGNPLFVSYLVKVKEADETTDAPPTGTSARAKKAVESYEERFQIDERKISSVTRLYLPDNTTDPNALTMADYFATKVISTFPGVQGGDQAWEFAEGILREVIEIRQINGEEPPLN